MWLQVKSNAHNVKTLKQPECSAKSTKPQILAQKHTEAWTKNENLIRQTSFSKSLYHLLQNMAAPPAVGGVKEKYPQMHKAHGAQMTPASQRKLC